MKKLIIFLLFFSVWLKAEAQDIIQYEYWYDSNYSSKISVNNTPEVILDLTTSLTGTSGLTPGLHTINYRAKDTDGKWSSTITEQFYATGNLNIEGYEYWFDDNYSSKIVNAVAPSQNFVLLSDLNTSAVGYGAHALNFRSRDSAGRWSVVIKEYFFKSVGGTQLSNAEYWIDSNYANKQPISFTSSNIVFINQNILTSNLDDQLHTLNFRMQDQSGKWSTVTSSYFMVNSLIVSYDYWFDTDFEHKITTTVTPTSILTNEPDFNSGSLPAGTHIVNFRAKNSSGKYSTTISQTITVVVNPNSTYYADSDGDGYGNISVMLVTNSQPSGYVLNNTDCDDTRASVHPGATEIAYDGLDNNCNGTIDEGFLRLQTNLNSALCGTTLPFIYTSVATPYVPVSGITGYRFKAKNMTTMAEQTIDRGLFNWFRLNQLPVYDFATTYEVSVELQRNGVWLGYYGNPCWITTPGVPVINQCGQTIAAGGALTTTALTGVTQYTFQVTNIAAATTQTFNKPSNILIVNQIPGYLVTTAYSVSVAIKTAIGALSLFGEACTINPAPATRFGTSVATKTGTEFKAVGAPNPFESNFTLSVTTVSDEKVQIAVYDMIGKQLESRVVSAQEATALEIGVNYPSGVYNVVVSQGDITKSLRMIKR